VFFVDATGRIVHANASGHALLAQGSPLRAASGKLVANCADAARSLNEIVAAAGQADAAGGIKGIAVALSAPDGVPYTAHVLPLTSGARRRTGASYAAAAAVFVRKATLEAPFAPEAIAGHFKLTPSELRVLLAVVQVGGIAETAEMLGIGVATVKTHLHRLFGKTGAIRQADLIRLVAGFANPLVS
jgi:DNA-binding CsgD family transcriptional regulator